MFSTLFASSAVDNWNTRPVFLSNFLNPLKLLFRCRFPFQLLRNTFSVLIKKIALDLMLRNVSTADSLPFENEQGFFGFQNRKGFFIEILRSNILGFRVGENYCTLLLSCLLTPSGIVPYLTLIPGKFR